MRQLFSIAVATFREAVRNKILYSILFFAVALIALSIALGSASLNQDVPVITSIGLTAIHFFSDLIAIFIGVTMVFQELERKTIYNILSKPVSRHSYFVGKFAGMALTLLVQLTIMSAVLAAVLSIAGGEVDSRYLAATLLTWVESLVVLSFALFFSSFSTPYVSGFLALGVWLVGGLTQNLTLYIPSVEDASARQLARSVVAVLPDFSLFDLTTQLLYAYPVTLEYVGQTVLYGASLGGVFLVAGAEIFRRRDFI